MGLPCGSVAKNPPANAGNTGSVPGSGRPPGEKKWQPTPIFLPGKSHGQRSLTGYSLLDRKELNTTATEQKQCDLTCDKNDILIKSSQSDPCLYLWSGNSMHHLIGQTYPN